MELERFAAEEDGDLDLSDFRESFEDCFLPEDFCLLLLTLMDEKPATDIEGFFEEDELEEFVERLNSAGPNCYVVRDPESSSVESVAEYRAEVEPGSELLEKRDSSDLVARIFVTREDYSEEFFRPLLEKEHDSKFHRRYGEFLGFHEEDVEAFVYLSLPFWRKILYRIRNGKPGKSMNPEEIFEKYASDEVEKVYTAFTFHRIADSRQRFEDSYRKAVERNEAVEGSEIHLSYFYTNLDRREMKD